MLNSSSNKSRFLLLFILYGSLFLFGFLENIKGVSFPLIKNEFDVSYETQGLMISIISISYTVFVIVSGFMVGHFGTKNIFICGLLCLFLSVLSIYFMPSFWTVACSQILLFASFGIIDITTNAIATQIFIKKAALMMNLLHFMYGVGAIASPKVAGILVNPGGLGLLWRQIYLLPIPLVLIIIVLSILAKFPSSVKNEAAGVKKTSFLTALKTPSVWAIGITLGVMVGVELAFANWGGLYFHDLYGMDPTTYGANFISAFYILFTLSRLLSGFLIEKIGYMRSLFASSLLSTLFFSIGFALGGTGIFILPVLGLFLGFTWPTILAVAIGFFGNDAPVMTAAVMAIAGLLNSGIQLIMGYINHWIGAGWGFRSCLLFSIIIICLLLGLMRMFKKSET